MKIIRAAFVALALAASFLAGPAALAGSSCQYMTTGAVLTAAQWNSCFQAKENELGYTPVNKAGDGMTGLLTTLAPTTTTAGFRLYPGVAPSAPTNGDLWTTSAGLFVRINGTTVGPLRDSTGGSFAGTSPITVSFPASVVTYAFDFTVANSWLATQTMRTILAGTTNTYDIGTSAAADAFRTIYAGTSFVGPVGTFTTSAAVGGATIGGNAFAVTGTSLFNSGVTMGAALTYGGVALSNSVTGTGSMVLSASPTFTGTPVLSTPTATSIAVGGCVISTNAICATGTANVSGAMTIGGALTYGGVTLSNSVTGTGSMVLSTSPSLTTPNVGAATATTINGNTFTAGTYTLTGSAAKTLTFSNSLTLAGTDGKTLTLTTGLTVSTNDGTIAFGAASKTLTVNKSLALDGTDGTTMTFPSTTATLAGLGVTNAFTGANSFSGVTTWTGSLIIPIRTVTAAGAITVSATTDYFICVNKSVGAATAVDLPASPATGATFLIKDCKGDAASNNITVTPAAGNIDNAASYTMSTNLGSVAVTYNGTQWLVN